MRSAAAVVLALALGGPLDVRPDETPDWKADLRDVKAVLQAAGNELWKHAGDRPAAVVRVSPKGGPITLYRRGPNGEFIVRLDTGESYWAQYTYQMSHELGHVLAGVVEAEHRQKWFEESLCEAASLFVLRRSAETWKTAPPLRGSESFAPELRGYADQVMKGAGLPAGKTLAAWYGENQAALEAKEDDRPRNRVVALELLPLLEKEPERWESLAWLNAEKLPRDASFAAYLAAWRKRAPERHRAFIAEVTKRFAVE
jgi:hypothetical protein